MRKVLFVCTGNTCRSPMAAALFRYRAGEMGWEALSAGTFAILGSPASENSVTAMKELGIDISNHRSQPLTAELARGVDLIITMTAEQRAQIVAAFPDLEERVFLINAFGTSRVAADVSDPFGGSLREYFLIRDEIDRALSDLILFIRTGKNRKGSI